MINRWSQLLHRQLTRELTVYEGKRCLTVPDVEHCFRTAYAYCKRLRDGTHGYRFFSTQQEILFFKKRKPLFTAAMEYYSLRYHALLFQPTDPAASLGFWQRENSRLEKFIDEHRVFFAYYKNGDCCLDEDYFLRKNRRERGTYTSECFVDQPDWHTDKDHLVALLLAQEKFNAYSENKLRKLAARQD